MNRLFNWTSKPNGNAAINGSISAESGTEHILKPIPGARMEPVENQGFQNVSKLLPSLHTVEADLQSWKSQDWYNIAWAAGKSRLSESTKEKLIAERVQEFINFQLELHKLLKLRLKTATIELYTAGDHNEKVAIAKINKAFIEEEIAACLDQISKDHINDRMSDISSIIKTYQNGFDDGHLTSLKNNGSI